MKANGKMEKNRELERVSGLTRKRNWKLFILVSTRKTKKTDLESIGGKMRRFSKGDGRKEK